MGCRGVFAKSMCGFQAFETALSVGIAGNPITGRHCLAPLIGCKQCDARSTAVSTNIKILLDDVKVTDNLRRRISITAEQILRPHSHDYEIYWNFYFARCELLAFMALSRPDTFTHLFIYLLLFSATFQTDILRPFQSPSSTIITKRPRSLFVFSKTRHKKSPRIFENIY